MSCKHRWDYHEALASVMERLQKEWNPPAAPCATPSTTLAKKRTGTVLPNCEEEKSKLEMRRCYMYNLQMNDSHIFLSRKSWQDVRMRELKEKSTQNQLQKKDVLFNSGMRRETLKPSKLHYTVFQYSGPNKPHSGTTLVFKRVNPQKTQLVCSVHNSSVKDSAKPFHLELPQHNLRVGSVVPRKQAKLYQHKQVKLKDHTAVNIIGL